MKSLLKKKSILIAVLTVLLVGTGVAATLAYLSSQTPTLVNTFTVGNVTTKIVEDFKPVDLDTYDKYPRVQNTGENDCYVRARVVCSPDKALDLLNFDPKWGKEKADGFYYYDGILKAPGKGVTESETITEPIFEQVQVKENMLDKIDGFEVTVYQEAVQTKVYAQDGTFTTDPETIWDCYESGEVPASFGTNS